MLVPLFSLLGHAQAKQAVCCQQSQPGDQCHHSQAHRQKLRLINTSYLCSAPYCTAERHWLKLYVTVATDCGSCASHVCCEPFWCVLMVSSALHFSCQCPHILTVCDPAAGQQAVNACCLQFLNSSCKERRSASQDSYAWWFINRFTAFCTSSLLLLSAALATFSSCSCFSSCSTRACDA